MFTERTSAGLDVHARSVVASAIDTATGELFKERLVPKDEVVVEWLRRLPGPVAVAYEAGPTGFGTYRAITAAGIRCVVAAPSKLSRPSGDRVKTDARDALLLARLLRNDDLTSVRVPSVAQEAARDLVRAREDVRGDLMRARHRVTKLQLRHGELYCGGAAWTKKHLDWLSRQRHALPGTQAAFNADLEAVEFAMARRDRLDAVIAQMAADSEFSDLTHRLGCLRGISTLTGFALAVEIGDWHRFTGNSIGSYLGLVPCEHSTGRSRRLGAITKTGNSHVRRLLIESAWHHRPVYRVGPTLRARWELAPEPVRVRAHAGNLRLHRRWTSYTERHKKFTVATTAIARELAGWCWSLAVMD